MSFEYSVYILSNKRRSVLYIGVTNSLERRIYEHKNKLVKGFTARYNVDQLVYFETFENIEDAVTREKQLKAGSRKNKLDLINSVNPQWNDLSGS